MDNFITVFTATYNRGDKLPILYKSLLAQTNKKFEWIVIDDGSTDMTEKYFENIDTVDFPIYYFKTVNGGKHRAINLGVKKAKGNYFFIVDSDDSLLPYAIDKVYTWIKKLPDDFAGVSGLRGFSESQPMGNIDCFSGREYLDKTNIERRKMNSLQDMAEVYRTEILKQYPFPEFEGENFLTEGIVWNSIAADGYKIRWYKTIIYICEYLKDGLTYQGRQKLINNKKGYGLSMWQEIHYFPHTLKEKMLIYNDFYCDMYKTCNLQEISDLVKFPLLLYWIVVVIFKIRKLFHRKGVK